MTPKQVELARHALGFNGREKFSYRNHYCASPDDAIEWEKMVSDGNAVRGRVSELSGGDPIYYVTKSAALSVRKSNEHLGRDTVYPEPRP